MNEVVLETAAKWIIGLWFVSLISIGVLLFIETYSEGDSQEDENDLF